MQSRNEKARVCAVTSATAAIVLFLASIPAAGAEDDKRFGEEILEILRDEGKIDDARYEELKKKEAEEAAEREPDWTIKYSNGLEFIKNDGSVKFEIGGRIQADFATIHTDDELDRAVPGGDGQGVEFRRARFYMSGELYERIVWKSQIDFAGGDVTLRDMYIGMKLGPVGTMKVGHFKEPYSLEELTSSKYNTFMERSLPSLFDSSRNFGLGFENSHFDDRFTWAMGVFVPTDDGGEFFSNDTRFNLIGRVTGLPLYRNEGRQLIHLGASVGYGFQDSADRRFRQRPEVHLTERYLDTGTFQADGTAVLGVEVVGIFGPVHVSGEWKQNWVDRDGARDVTGYGGYAAAGVFLTGEHRPFQKSNGTWARVEPTDPFDPKEGKWGAWELAARYSYIRLNNHDLDGGKEQNATAALNWYLYSNVRLSLNYVFANVRNTGVSRGLDGAGSPLPANAGGDIHTFQARLQLEF
jgi:phosphate-selective porin OprO/OprP